jgi:hypothetical protein
MPEGTPTQSTADRDPDQDRRVRSCGSEKLGADEQHT